MNDEHRKRLDNRLVPLDLYKITPKTNCGECGFLSCLAFSTQVIVGQGDINACPYLERDEIAPFLAQLGEQLNAGIGLRQEGFEKTLRFLREEVENCRFDRVAHSLGATLLEKNGKEALWLPYFDEGVTVTVDDVVKDSGSELSPWEKIFIYNYIIGGAVEPSGRWVGMESLPNSISKIKSLRSHCEEPLAQRFKGRMDALAEVALRHGSVLELGEERADFAAEFRVFPKLAIRVFWYDEDPEEGFKARVKFLFDAKVLDTIDLESLLFACEQVADRLIG